MRVVRKLMVFAVMVFATMAFGASSASAVEVSDEASTIHCDPVTIAGHVTSGGCPVRATSEGETLVQVFHPPTVSWITISSCEDQFEAAIGEDGTGALYDAVTTGHQTGNPCTRQQCDEVNGTKNPWPLRLANATSMEITFCLRQKIDRPGTGGVPCHTTIAVTNGPNHSHEFRANGTTSGVCETPGVRLIGHWNVVADAGHPAIEIN